MTLQAANIAASALVGHRGLAGLPEASLVADNYFRTAGHVESAIDGIMPKTTDFVPCGRDDSAAMALILLKAECCETNVARGVAVEFGWMRRRRADLSA